MSKYVLKRDLPFAKAGENINFMKTSSDQENFYLNDKTFFVSDAGFQKLIDEDWIEEVPEKSEEQKDSDKILDLQTQLIEKNTKIFFLTDENNWLRQQHQKNEKQKNDLEYELGKVRHELFDLRRNIFLPKHSEYHKGDEPKIKKPREFELYIDGLNLVEANMFSKDIGTRLNFAKECNPITLQRVKVREVIK